MKDDGTYNLDFTSDKVIMNGYEFIRTEYPGIYKAAEEYLIDMHEWRVDKRNKDLIAFTVVLVNKPKNVVLYIARYDCEYKDIFSSNYDYISNNKIYENIYGQDNVYGIGFIPCMYSTGFGSRLSFGGVVFDI